MSARCRVERFVRRADDHAGGLNPAQWEALCYLARANRFSRPAAAPVPASVTRAQIEAGFTASAPVYQNAPGLRRKWFLISGDGRIGGVYLWTDRAAADAFYSAAWHDRVRKTYGQDASIRYFEAPVVMRH